MIDRQANHKLSRLIGDNLFENQQINKLIKLILRTNCEMISNFNVLIDRQANHKLNRLKRDNLFENQQINKLIKLIS